MLKLFIVKKYVIAESAEDAIKKERRVRPDDVWVDEDFRKNSKIDLPGAIGYHIEHDYYSSDEWAKNPRSIGKIKRLNKKTK